MLAKRQRIKIIESKPERLILHILNSLRHSTGQSVLYRPAASQKQSKLSKNSAVSTEMVALRLT